MQRLTLFLSDIVAIATNGELPACCPVYERRCDGSALTSKGSSNLLNDDTYRCVWHVIVSSIGQIEQGAH